MPICSDPNATTEICLRIDLDKPIETRPVFISRFITSKKKNEVSRLYEAAFAAKEDAECFKLLVQAMKIGIVGWRNFNDPDTGKPLTFDEDGIRAALTDAEIFEIAANYPSRVSQQEMSPKNRHAIASATTQDSRSQSPVDGEKSASDAAATTDADTKKD